MASVSKHGEITAAVLSVPYHDQRKVLRSAIAPISRFPPSWYPASCRLAAFRVAFNPAFATAGRGNLALSITLECADRLLSCDLSCSQRRRMSLSAAGSGSADGPWNSGLARTSTTPRTPRRCGDDAIARGMAEGENRTTGKQERVLTAVSPTGVAPRHAASHLSQPPCPPAGDRAVQGSTVRI